MPRTPGEEPPADLPPPGEAATRVLRRLADGDADASSQLLPLVYAELRALAGAYFRGERAGHTLQPTALVHEAWIRLVGSDQPAYAGRTHFLAIAAITMRRILVEHARGRATAKRGGGREHVTLDDAAGGQAAIAADVDVLAVHEALERLAALSPRQAEIVELRWFGGLTVAEVAEHLGLVTRTVEKDWTMAKAWLARELAGP